MVAARCPSRLSACASNCTDGVLPLVPVTPIIVIACDGSLEEARGDFAELRAQVVDADSIGTVESCGTSSTAGVFVGTVPQRRRRAAPSAANAMP